MAQICPHNPVYGRLRGAGSIAKNCAVVVEYKIKMDKDAAIQLASAVDFIEKYKEEGVESMAKFKGKRIIGLLAGRMQTSDTKNKLEVDTILQVEGLEKRFFQAYYAPDPCSPFQTSGTFPLCAGPGGPDASPRNGTATTTPAAPPRRVRQVAIPMRRAQFQTRPRLVKFAGFKLSSLI
ncbi:hypothetical protein KSW81_001529 [Nannochloris sp. 'desiccata']|nr:hypothetical protein KSW81_001529 [Chlorella desiccata (nom. nud.)]